MKPALRSILLVLGALAAAAVATPAYAQSDPSCTYDACAVRIESTFFGGQYLARGVAAERVASLSPFSTSVRRALAGSDSASVYAATFHDKYRWGSAMALAGSVIGTVPLILQGDDFSDIDVAFTITGYGIALVGGWMIQSAWRDLNRGIWWYNREFSGSAAPAP